MWILRRYESGVDAEHAAMFLREHGIAAGVYGHGTAFARTRSGLPRPAVDLVLHDRSQREEAERLLGVLDASPIELQDDWERCAEPDIAGLDLSGVPITCPACEAPLELDVNIVECAGCGLLIDAVERIIEQHGPDALADAMPAPADPDDDPDHHGAGRSAPG
ncbi:MAG: hypothetical protein ACTS3F_05375 [Phycisphaerales bacterium]